MTNFFSYLPGMGKQIERRLSYYHRIFSAYLVPQTSHLTFWHDVPECAPNFRNGELGEYYMPFTAKANYSAQYDANGVPLLNYRGKVGLQYNPIAIAQYGLGNYNLFLKTGEPERRRKFLVAADWLVRNLELNRCGLWVWNHHFDWEYRTPLKAPWYSGLAQGQGISLLVRVYKETMRSSYLHAAERAFDAFHYTIDQGGVVYVDSAGHVWFEEYVVFPPTHILNGFIWASWGVYDFFLATGSPKGHELFKQALETLVANLHRYDIGFWSLYEHSGTILKMVASPFYHALHIVQLKVLYALTGQEIFQKFALRWDYYQRKKANRMAALTYKAAFKILYY